jgi:hypothetical protein
MPIVQFVRPYLKLHRNRPVGQDVARKCCRGTPGAEDFLSAASANRRVNGSSAYLHVRNRMLRVGASN